MMTIRDSDTARREAARWLASAADPPASAQTAWQETGIALLRVGRIADVVRVHETVVYAAAGSHQAASVDAFLLAALDGGPVFRHRRSRAYYALVPVGTAANWPVPEGPWAAALGDDGVSLKLVGVPDPESAPGARVWSYWPVPPAGPGALCEPEAVRDLVTRGRARLAAHEEEAEARRWTAI
jgi:hypothetical protein